MTYGEGFVLAVPADKKEAYRRHAAEAVPLFKEFGVTRQVEAWGDDVPDGKVTDFKGAVKAEPGEVVVRSEEHTSELQSLMSISYAVFCLKQKKKNSHNKHTIILQ